MKHLLITAATLALTAPAFAQDAATDAPNDAAAVEQSAQDGAQPVENAAEATENAANDAASATAEATTEAAAGAENAAEEAAAEAESAAEATEQAAEETAERAEDAANAAAENAEAAEDAAESAEQGEVVVAPDVNAPAISAQNPGMLSSWVTDREIYTTNQPADSEWSVFEGDAVPEDWDSIAKVGDIVIDSDNNVIGYVADIGGFLGLGAKKVLLGTEAIKLAHFGDDSVFATNYTKAELEALPEFDEDTVMPVHSVTDAPASGN